MSERGRHYYKIHDVVFSSKDHIAMLRTEVAGFVFFVLDFHYIVSRRGGPEEEGPPRLPNAVRQVSPGLDGVSMSKDPENGYTALTSEIPRFSVFPKQLQSLMPRSP